jgi:hypothetical protein
MLRGFATGQSSEFGSNHEQVKSPVPVTLQQRQPPPPGNGVAGVELQVGKQTVDTGANGGV